MDAQYQNEQAEMKSLLQHLLNGKLLEGVAAGIARQVIARGEGSLSERQERVFANKIQANYLLRVCRVCEQLIPFSEVLDSLANGDLCADCARILAPSSCDTTT
jgi:hypothetical protein